MAKKSIVMNGVSLRRCIAVLCAAYIATATADAEDLLHKRQLVAATGGSVAKAAQTIGVNVQKGAAAPPPAASAQPNPAPQAPQAPQAQTPPNPAPQGPALTPLANAPTPKPQAQPTQAQQPSNPTPAAALPARPTTVGVIQINAAPNVAVNTASPLVFSLFTPKAAVTLTLAAINAPAPGQQGLPSTIGIGFDNSGLNNGQGNGQNNGQNSGQINGQGNGQINGQGTGQINGQQNGQNNGQINGQQNGQNNGQINGQGNGQGNGLANNQPQVPASIGPALGTITVTQGPAGGAPGVANAPQTAGIIGNPAPAPSPNAITVRPGGAGSNAQPQPQPQQPQIPGQPQQPQQPGQPGQPGLGPAATVTVNVGGQGAAPQPQQPGQPGQPIQPNQPAGVNGPGGQVVGLGPVPPASIVSIKPNGSPVPGVGNTGNVGAGVSPNVNPNLPQGLAGAVGPNACTCNCLCPPGSFNMGSVPQIGQMPGAPLGVNQPQAVPGQQPAVTIVPQGQGQPGQQIPQGQPQPQGQIPNNQGQQGANIPPQVAPTTLATLPAASPQQQLPQPVPGQNPNGGNVGVQGPLGQLTIGGSVIALQTAVTQPLVKRRNPHQRPQ